MAAKPPKSKKAPENAHVLSEFMSFGVMASWHCSGFAARGMMKPSCDDQQHDLKLQDLRNILAIGTTRLQDQS